MTRLQVRLARMETRVEPQRGDAVLMRVPASEQHLPKLELLTRSYAERDIILWPEDGTCLPERRLWVPLLLDDLSDRELDDSIAAVSARVNN